MKRIFILSVPESWSFVRRVFSAFKNQIGEFFQVADYEICRIVLGMRIALCFLGHFQKALSKQFAPEFLNRLDEIITFDQLDNTAIRKIVDIELSRLFKRINDMGYAVEISDEAKTLLANKGYSPQYGARPLKRAIQTYIEDVLCELLLSDEKRTSKTIAIDVDGDDKLKVEFKESAAE